MNSVTPQPIEFGQVQRLTDRLRELVRKYPKGVGLFKEFLQNADDAGASTLRVFLDARHHSVANLANAQLSVLQGPALVFVNDQPFLEKDWQKIQEIGNSGKVDDVQKTGRFGLGFNSVYNVTDYPMLLSRGLLGVFDPHQRIVPEKQNRPGVAWKIDDLKAAESDVLTPFYDYQLDDTAEFAPAVFRLPLRTRDLAGQSEISSEPFTPDDFKVIVDGVCDQGNGLLLFLNSVLGFDIQLIRKDGSQKSFLSVQTTNTDAVVEARRRVRENLHNPIFNSPEVLGLFGTGEIFYEHEIQTEKDEVNTSEVWSIVRGLYATDELIAGATAMARAGEKAVPLAGAAVQVSAPVEQGMLSCTLPLPTSSGMPLHIDGYFDLQDSRQDLHQDETATGFHSQTRVDWNRSLLKDGCATAAATLLKNVGDKLGRPAYTHWPVVQPSAMRLVDELPRLIYERLAMRDCITAGPAFEFCLPSKVLRAPNKLREPLLADRLYITNPPVPKKVQNGFGAVASSIPSLVPAQLCQHLKRVDWSECLHTDSPVASLRIRSWLIDIVAFCLQDDDPSVFDGVPLALMEDGMLRVFGYDLSDPIYLGASDERQLLEDLSQVFLDEEIQELDLERLPGVVSMDFPELINQLPKLFTSISDGRYLEHSAAENHVPSNDWLLDFYRYCVVWIESEPFRRLPEPESLSRLPLVPDTDGDLWAMGIPSTPIFESHRKQSNWKSTLVELAGKQFVSFVNQINEAIRGFQDTIGGGLIRSFSPDIVAELLEDVDAMEAFAEDRSNIEGLIGYLASSHSSSTNRDSLSQLAKLPIFPTTDGRLTALNPGPVYLASDFAPPSVGLSVTVLSTKDEQQYRLLEKLGAKPLTCVHFVVDNLFESYEQLDATAQFTAMEWFRREYFAVKDEVAGVFDETIDELVRHAKIVRCEDGQVRSPAEVYHPNCQAIAAALPTSVHYPDPHFYGSDDWLNFLSTLGVNDQIQASDVLAAIDSLLAGEFSQSDANCIYQIAELIDTHWDDLSSQPVGADSFAAALNARAWLPAMAVCPNDYPQSLFKTPTRILFKPEEILLSQNRDLAGSIHPICRFPIGRNLASALTFKRLFIEDVCNQLDNVTAIALEEKPGKHMRGILHQIYDCLGRSIADDGVNFSASDLEHRYRNQPCLIDEQGRMWAPHDSFKRGAEIFLGYRGRIAFAEPLRESFASACGRRDSPNLDDYRRFFLQLHDDLHDQIVPDDRQATLATAYQRAAKLATANELSDCSVLTDSGTLIPTSQLLLDDAPWLSTRARQAGLQFLHKSLGATVAIAFGVGQLSKVVSERIDRFCETDDSGLVQVSSQLERTMRSSEFARGVFRLMAPEKRNRDFVAALQGLAIRPACRIQSLLYWEDDELPDSTGTADYVFDGQTIYCDAIKKTVLCRRIASTICNRLLSAYEITDEASISAIVGEAPEETMELLDQMQIPDVPEDEQLDVDVEGVAFAELPNERVSQPGSSTTATCNTIRGASSGYGSTNQPRESNLGNLSSDSKPTIDFGSTMPRGPRKREDRRSANTRRRVVTYVYPGRSAELSESQPSGNQEIDQAAISAVIEHEQRLLRHAISMDQFNEGYDIESRVDHGGEIVRYIEVKGQRGAWGDRGISLTDAQVRFCEKHGDRVWLYVVEFATDPDRRVIYEFQNPVRQIKEYRLDAGWKALCTSTTSVATPAPTEGGRVSLAEAGEGTIIKIEEFGSLKKLSIKLDSGESRKVNYPHSKVQLLA